MWRCVLTGGRNSKKIAKLLLERTMAGDLASAKLLLNLAEQTPAEPRPYRSVAINLASEPEWDGDEPEFDREN